MEETNHVADLSKKVIEFIRTHRVSMNKLEKKCGIYQALLSKVLKGKANLPLEHVRALAKELKKHGFQ